MRSTVQLLIPRLVVTTRRGQNRKSFHLFELLYYSAQPCEQLISNATDRAWSRAFMVLRRVGLSLVGPEAAQIDRLMSQCCNVAMSRLWCACARHVTVNIVACGYASIEWPTKCLVEKKWVAK